MRLKYSHANRPRGNTSNRIEASSMRGTVGSPSDICVSTPVCPAHSKIAHIDLSQADLVHRVNRLSLRELLAGIGRQLLDQASPAEG